MARIMLVFPDGQNTYGVFDTDDDGDYFVIGKVRYTIDDVVKTGALAVVGNPDMLRRLHSLGIPVRPSSKPHTVSLSLSSDTHDRLKAVAAETNRSVSNIVEEAAVSWLENHNA